jgi:hypothetical protein
MINVSSEFKTLIKGNDRKFYGGAEITLADATVLTLDNTKIMSLKIEDMTSQNDEFTIGSAIINEMTLTINNLTEEFSDYDFTDAVIRPTVGLKLSETTETLNKGVFTADDPKAIGSIITLTALDNMVKFDTPFKDVVLVFPTTPILLLSAVCLHCGVTLATTTFLNDDFTITERPLDDAVSCREVVSWIAQLSGNFARMNTSGQLELKWYDFEIFEEGNLDGGTFDDTEETSYQSGDSADGGNFTDYTSGDNIDGGSFTDLSRFHHFYSLSQFSVATDDVVITGISVTDSAETPNTVLYGQVGYVISLEGNKLIQSLEDATTIANSVGAAIVGMRFRPLNLNCLSDPSIESGDVAYVSDRKGNVYQTLITNVIYGIGQATKITCDAESPSRNSSVRYSEATKAIIEARKNTELKLSAYDLTVQQFLNLMTYGFGLYKSSEVLGDGSTIFYMHDKATIAESDAVWKFSGSGIFLSTDHGLTWGVDTNGNMLVNVLTAIGVNAEWIKVLTSFTVGTQFSVDSSGKLVCSNADISGKITATEGSIAGMVITAFGLQKTITVGSETFEVGLQMDNNGFWLQTNNSGDTERAFVNATYDANNHPVINIAVVDTNGYNDSRVMLNGKSILDDIDTLYAKVSNITNFLIQRFQYDPSVTY